MSSPCRIALGIAALAVLVTCSSSPSEHAPAPTLPTRAQLQPGWNELHPGADTTCALGTEYAFFAHDGDPDRLMIYLQGGGACWRGENCDPDSRPTYSRDVNEHDSPAGRPVGIFDLDNVANPVRDWSMVMVPYCTGDVHLGDRVATYRVQPDEGDPYEVTIQHHGYGNVMAVLDWVFANYETPGEVLVTGSSAGSIPSPFYAGIVADHYPEAKVIALGDGSGSYRRTVKSQSETIRRWGTLAVVQRYPGFEQFQDDTLGFEDLYVVAGQRHPEMQLLQYDSAHDAVQGFYLRLGQDDAPDVRSLIEQNRQEIRTSIGNFHSFLAGGPEHTVLWRAALYDYEADGTLVRDWLAAALRGEPVRDVVCAVCDFPELHYDDSDAAAIAQLEDMLRSAERWNHRDDGTCVPDSPWSLACALQLAGEVTGANSRLRRALGLEVSLREPDLPGRGSPLQRFNNAPGTTFADVRTVIEAVAARVEAHERRHGNGRP